LRKIPGLLVPEHWSDQVRGHRDQRHEGVPGAEEATDPSTTEAREIRLRALQEFAGARGGPDEVEAARPYRAPADSQGEPGGH
jgi:hypothetical protein